MSDKDNRSWKDALLRTSLPLEFLVAEKLETLGFYVSGEFPYTRENENGLIAEFSVDIACFRSLVDEKHGNWGNLHFLVECKYNHPSVKWVFARHPDTEAMMIFGGVINKFQDLCTQRLVSDDCLYSLDHQFPYCFKGVQLHNSDAHSSGVTHGLSQLRWAVPQLAANITNSQARALQDSELKIGFMCPILVTNAPLFVMKRGVDLAKVMAASNIEEIADSVGCLIVSQDRGPQLDGHVQKMFDGILLDAPVADRLRVYWPLIRNEFEQRLFDYRWDFRQTIDSISKRILVVNLDHFDHVVSEIQESVRQVGAGLKRIGNLVWSPETGSRIENA